MANVERALLLAWPWVLSLAILTPLLAPGFVLSYDMVFVPELALRPDFFGTGSALPRAVPSDALVALADDVLPGSWLQKLLLLAALGTAGAGVVRLTRDLSTTARLAGVSGYVWSTYVAERLVLGHWALLLGFAALPWVLDAAGRWAGGDRERSRGEALSAVVPLVLWCALGATSPSGGVLTGVAALVVVMAQAPGGRAAARRAALAAAVVLSVNAPWVVAGMFAVGDTAGDGRGVSLFASRAEGPLALLPTLVVSGGVWNAEVMPVTRESWLPVAWLVILLALVSVGVARAPRQPRGGYLALALLGLVVALAGSWAPEALGWLVRQVPGAGLLRDGSRYLPWLTLPTAWLMAHGVQWLQEHMHPPGAARTLAVGAVLAPIAFLPDLAWGVGGRLQPVSYPEEYAEARAAVVEEVARAEAAGERLGDVLLLPFSAYRQPEWNRQTKVLNPLGRYLPLDYLADDDLSVSGQEIEGEDPRAAEVEAILAEPGPGTAASLAGLGVGLVVQDRGAAGAGADLDVAALGEVVHRGGDLVVTRLGEVRETEVSDARGVAVALAWVMLVTCVCGALAVGIKNLWRLVRRPTTTLLPLPPRGHREGES